MKEIASPNCDSRDGADVTILVLHYTEMESAADSIARLCDPAARVSSHYVVDEDGTVTRLVPEDRRAWHAGVSHWAGIDNVNSNSIGVEIQNRGHPAGLPPYPEAQVAAVIALCRDICSRWPIPPRNIVAHSDIAPARKIDPGEHFPWARLAAKGVGLWPGEQGEGEGWVLRPGDAGAEVAHLRRDLTRYGYGGAHDDDGGDHYDEPLRLAVAAFQRHFRQEAVTGEADAETRARLTRLLQMAGL